MKKELRRNQAFYFANTKGCSAKRLRRFSTDDHDCFSVIECKVSYQRSHKFLCKATVTVGDTLMY